jgi:hypothetical protein
MLTKPVSICQIVALDEKHLGNMASAVGCDRPRYGQGSSFDGE